MAEIYNLSKRNPFNFSLGVNGTLILVNVIAFILFSLLIKLSPQLFGISGEVFFSNYIAISSKAINQGYVWTFLTSMFMHAGFFHLFINMLTLFFVGSLFQKIVGPKRYLGFYLIAGLAGGVLHVLFESVPAVGASGALFGVVGALILLTPNLPVYAMFIPIPIKLKYAGPGLLVLLWLISATAGAPIGNFAHLGGLLAGLGYGFYLTKKYKNKTRMIRKRFS